MVLEDASSGLKRERNRLIMEVLAVPAPPTNRDACDQENNLKKQLEDEKTECPELQAATRLIAIILNVFTSASHLLPASKIHALLAFTCIGSSLTHMPAEAMRIKLRYKA